MFFHKVTLGFEAAVVLLAGLPWLAYFSKRAGLLITAKVRMSIPRPYCVVGASTLAWTGTWCLRLVRVLMI